MAEWMEVMNQFDRMCTYYQREHKCPMGCPMSGVNISQCRKIAFECPDSVERTVMLWAAENPEPVYPSWYAWLANMGVVPIELPPDQAMMVTDIGLLKKIPADIAQKLGIEPKEG